MERVRYVNKILFLFIFFFSCKENKKIYNHTNDIVELGDNFYYLGDGKESQILLNMKPTSNHKFGQTIIPSEVIKYNFNERYIIAENQNIKGKKKYWIIDKHQNKSINSFDSLSFLKKIENINLNLKDR